MDLLGIGGWEVLLVLVITTLVMGPGKVVEVGRNLGRIARTLKKATFDLTSQVAKKLENPEKTNPPQQNSCD